MKRLLGSTIAAFFCIASMQVQAARITIVNADGAGEGLNDPSPRTPVGGNPGTTLGQQRFNALQAAADMWAALIESDMQISVNAQFNPLTPCNASSGVVGQAGPTTSLHFGDNPPPGAFANTYYPIALAEALSGTNQNQGNREINAVFNSDVDGPTCFGDRSFYYGINQGAAPTGTLAIFPTVLHELGHGLGFLSLVCNQAGGCGAQYPVGSYLNSGQRPDIWSHFLASLPSTRLWSEMTNAQRAASMVDDPNLVWTGPKVTETMPGLTAGTNAGFVRMHAPAALSPGSSVSHFSSALTPNEILEPVINSSVVPESPGRAVALMEDIGWEIAGQTEPDPNRIFQGGFED